MARETLSYFKRLGLPIIAKASGEGGPLCVLRLSGKNLKNFAPLFSSALPGPREFSYLTVANLDKAVVLSFVAPHSYTGEDVIEIQGHGVPSLIEKIIEAFERAGALRALPGEFSFRALLNNKMTLEEAEKLHTAIKSESINSESASELLGLGVQNNKIQEIFEELLNSLHSARGRVESAVDFPEAEEEQAQDVKNAREILEKFYYKASETLSAFEIFRSKASEPMVVLVGDVNAGKSTLFNILCGAKRSIVSKVAGTTRDYVEARLHTGLSWIKLVDTAGLRELNTQSDHDFIESEGISLSHELIDKASFIVCVQDARNESSIKLQEKISAKPSTFIFSHKDKIADHKAAFNFLSEETLVREHVLHKINEYIKSKAPKTNSALWLSDRQARHLEEAHKKAAESLALLKEDRALDLVAAHLQECERLIKLCVGRDLDESYIGEIFSQFCLGK